MADGYQVIARRWRPKQFDELVGQDHIVRTLSNAIESGRIAHAYLFVGPRGTGKTSTARLFAKALNCEDAPSAKPDNDSPLCQSIMAGTCMDVIEIDGASNNSVEQVRDLREDCQYAPSQARFKVYIIDEVHMLSTQAFNALLKTLEEPPPHVKFIFATTESHKVLPTIVSRCQRFEFRPIADELIIKHLGEIAEAEGIAVEEAALKGIASLAQGGMRDAQSILDQMISFCGKNIHESNVLDVYGLVSRADVRELAGALINANYVWIVDAVKRWSDAGRDLYRLLIDLQACVREALLDAISHGGKSDFLGTAATTESLLRMLDTLHAGEAQLRTGLSEKVNFEVTLLRAIDHSRTRAIDSVIQQISALAAGLPEDAGQKKISPKKAAKPSPKAKTPAEVPTTPEVSAPPWPVSHPHHDPEPAPAPPQAEAPPAYEASRGDSSDVPLPESTKAILQQKYRADYQGSVPVQPEEWLGRPEKDR